MADKRKGILGFPFFLSGFVITSSFPIDASIGEPQSLLYSPRVTFSRLYRQVNKFQCLRLQHSRRARQCFNFLGRKMTVVKTDDSCKGKTDDVVYVVGYGRLPDGTTAKHVYNMLGLGVELDRASGTILEVSCTTMPPHGNEILRKIIVGKKLEKDYDLIARQIRRRYIDRTRGALLAALEDILTRAKEAKSDSSS